MKKDEISLKFSNESTVASVKILWKIDIHEEFLTENLGGKK